MTSGDAFGPAITRATSPGTALTSRKVNPAVPRRVTADHNNRLVIRATIRANQSDHGGFGEAEGAADWPLPAPFLFLDPHAVEAPPPERLRQWTFEPLPAQGDQLAVPEKYQRGILH